MKKKAIALVMLMLAVVCIWLAIHATQNAILAWIGAVAFVLLAVHSWMGERKHSPETKKKDAVIPPTKASEVQSVASKKPETKSVVPKEPEIESVKSEVPIVTPTVSKSCEAEPATQKVSETKPAMPTIPSFQFIEFRLKGVNFTNEDGTSRQELIRKIDESEPPFENGGDLNVNLKPILFDGKDAIECRVNGYLIGFVPHELVLDVLEAIRAEDATISGFHVVGGGEKENGEKLNYGINMAVRFSKKTIQ